MLHPLRHFEAAKASFKSAVQYRAGMLLTILLSVVNVAVMYVIWGAVIAGGTYGGYTFNDMILHTVLQLIINALIWDDWNNMLGNAIHDGGLYKYIIRPVSLFAYAFWWKAGSRAFAFFVEALPMLLIFTAVFSPSFMTPEQPLAFLLALTLAFLYYLLFNMLIGFSAFWMKKTDGLEWIYIISRNILSGVLLPLSFYPETVQEVFFFLPFQYIYYVPSTAYIGNYALTSWNVTIWDSLIVGTVGLIPLGMLTTTVWWMGSKHYEGVGV